MKLLALAFISGLILSAGEKPVVISWDASNLRLSWVSIHDGKTKHVVDFKRRTMDANGKKPYRISEAERAEIVNLLLNQLTLYAVASEDWYGDGGVYRQQPTPRREREENGNQQQRVKFRVVR